MSVIQHKYVPVSLTYPNPAEQAQWVDKFGGYNPVTKTLTPFKMAPYSEDYAPTLSDMLQSIAAAVEEGLVDDEQWPVQLFGSREVLDSFLTYLESYDDTYRIVDPWWQALAALMDASEEAGLVRSEELADGLTERIGQLEDEGVEYNWPA